MATAKGKKKVTKKKSRDFSATEKLLVTATSIVAFGGIMFSVIMILLMTSINY